MPLILEGLVTTLNANVTGAINLAPMGPIVNRELTQLTLRPFRSSQTYCNLKSHPEGIFHVTDDVDLFARATIGQLSLEGEMFQPAKKVAVPALVDACRWIEFRIDQLDDLQERATIHCRIVDYREGRPFLGFNRAKHAVIEAAILASRVGIVPTAEIHDELRRLAVMVQKTAGDQETAAFLMLKKYIDYQSSIMELDE